MATAELSRRVEKVVGFPPLSEMDADQRREFQEALFDADSFENLKEVARGDPEGRPEPADLEAFITDGRELRDQLVAVIHGARFLCGDTPGGSLGWLTGCSLRAPRVARLP
jgi:hypothetical protein